MSMFDNNQYNSSSSQFSGTQIGGGFMNNTQNNENFNTSNYSRGGGQGQQKSMVPYDQRKMAQITIKQIITAPPVQPDSPLTIDGVEVTQVQMLAQIKSIDIQSSHTTLVIDDLTGSLNAKQWGNDTNQSEQFNFSEGQWVRIFGRTNMYNGRCSINIIKMFPITSHDEIAHHFLECIYSHLFNTTDRSSITGGNTKNQNQNPAQNGNYGGNNNQYMNNNNMGNNSNNNNYGNNNGNNGWGNQGGLMMNNANNNLSQLEVNMINIIRAPEYQNSDAGCNVDRIFQQLSNEDVNDIRSAIDKLAEEGHIYSTVDDEHYKYCGDQQ